MGTLDKRQGQENRALGTPKKPSNPNQTPSAVDNRMKGGFDAARTSYEGAHANRLLGATRAFQNAPNETREVDLSSYRAPRSPVKSPLSGQARFFQESLQRMQEPRRTGPSMSERRAVAFTAPKGVDSDGDGIPDASVEEAFGKFGVRNISDLEKLDGKYKNYLADFRHSANRDNQRQMSFQEFAKWNQESERAKEPFVPGAGDRQSRLRKVQQDRADRKESRRQALQGAWGRMQGGGVAGGPVDRQAAMQRQVILNAAMNGSPVAASILGEMLSQGGQSERALAELAARERIAQLESGLKKQDLEGRLEMNRQDNRSRRKASRSGVDIARLQDQGMTGRAKIASDDTRYVADSRERLGEREISSREGIAAGENKTRMDIANLDSETRRAISDAEVANRMDIARLQDSGLTSRAKIASDDSRYRTDSTERLGDRQIASQEGIAADANRTRQAISDADIQARREIAGLQDAGLTNRAQIASGDNRFRVQAQQDMANAANKSRMDIATLQNEGLNNRAEMSAETQKAATENQKTYQDRSLKLKEQEAENNRALTDFQGREQALGMVDQIDKQRTNNFNSFYEQNVAEGMDRDAAYSDAIGRADDIANRQMKGVQRQAEFFGMKGQMPSAFENLEQPPLDASQPLPPVASPEEVQTSIASLTKQLGGKPPTQAQLEDALKRKGFALDQNALRWQDWENWARGWYESTSPVPYFLLRPDQQRLDQRKALSDYLKQ